MRSLVILTYDEIAGSRALFDRIPWQEFQECVVVDGGSKDGTIEFYHNEGVRVVFQKERGRGAAFHVGMQETKGEYVVFFSPDGNENPNDIPKLFNLLESGYDMVIASRFLKGSRNEEDGSFFPLRKWANQVFTFLANWFWQGKISDTINGFRGVSRQAFAAMGIEAKGFSVEYLMSIRALKLKLKVKEIATKEGDRIGGRSKSVSFPTGWEFLRCLLREKVKGGKPCR